MIGSPTKLATSGQIYYNFGPSYFINNNTEYIQPVIAALLMIQKLFCKFCGIIGHKDDVCIVRGPELLPPIIRIKMNHFNSLHGEEPSEPPI